MSTTTLSDLQPGVTAGTREPPPGHRRRRRLTPHRTSLVVLLVGMALTGGLTAASRINYLDNQHRLIQLDTRLSATSLSAAPLDLERRLGQAVSLVAATGRPAVFADSITSSTETSGPFVAVDLYRLNPVHEILALDFASLLDSSSPRLHALLAESQRTNSLAVTWITEPRGDRLGYAMAATGTAGTYAVYAEQVLPVSHRVTLPRSSPDYGLDVAIYFGSGQSPANLLETNVAHPPLTGDTASAEVRLGDQVITLVLSARGSLTGTFAELLAPGIAIIGVLVTIAFALLVERLVRRREGAESLAADNERLYEAQRDLARSLQHALLPQELPRCPNLELAARYVPGTEGIEIGGDWYDVVPVDDDHVFFAVGDVAGRGLAAAVLMASLRNAINAYAADGDGPSAVLGKIDRLVDVARDARYATVLCGVIDTVTGRAVLANAGHPPPLLVDTDGAHFVETVVGPPVGVGSGEYGTVPVRLAPRATLLVFTDGLVERRGESLSTGLTRLRESVHEGEPVTEMLDEVLQMIRESGSPDDVAVLGLRWLG